MDLIPGLPNDVALECLIRISLQSLSASRQVSSSWKAEIERPEFSHRRESIGSTQKLIVVVHAKPAFNPDGSIPLSRLSLHDLETDEWSVLPSNPDLPHGLPNKCQVVAVGSKLMVLGRRNPAFVFVYNFLAGTWSRGAPMLDDRDVRYACVTSFDHTVYVVGGTDNEHNCLSSAMAYNVAEDEWTWLPPMSIGCALFTGTLKDGLVHVAGGLTGNLKRMWFCESKESFDVVKGQWSPILEDGNMLTNLSSGYCDGKIYECADNKNLYVQDGTTWRVVTELPDELKSVVYVTGGHGKLLVVGSSKSDEPCNTYTMDLNSYIWTRMDLKSHRSEVRSVCYLKI